MPAKQQPRYVRAKEPATGDLDGEPFVVNPSEIFADDHPIVRAHPDLFEPLEPSRQRPDVEQMTAAPGEKRGSG
jgi:hypothetical protein